MIKYTKNLGGNPLRQNVSKKPGGSAFRSVPLKLSPGQREMSVYRPNHQQCEENSRLNSTHRLFLEGRSDSLSRTKFRAQISQDLSSCGYAFRK